MLASHGARATRNASNFIPHSSAGAVGKSRAIHIPSFVRAHPRIPQVGPTQKLFTQSRNLLAQFFTHLTAPGLRIPTSSPVARSLQTAARAHHVTIQQGFSLPVKTTLSRPLRSPILPRAPALPRTVTQVGLGTARNFSSSRPIFQNLVENVPIVGRVFYEADWEVKMRREEDMMRKRSKSTSSKSHSKEMLKPTVQCIILNEKKVTSQQLLIEAELDQYFLEPIASDVTTYLLIPLAPTPTNHVPLPPSSHTSPSLLPLPALASMHASHETHSLRVSSLFSRLDAANVWERGVQCSAFSHGGDHNGVCTMLKVEFTGWTKAEVRGVLGESGTGWCVLEEIKTSAQRQEAFDYDDDLLSNASSDLSGLFEDSRLGSPLGFLDGGAEMDPSQSFVLPTLDFSSSFITSCNPSPPLSRISSNLDSFSFSPSDSDFDPWLDSESSSDGGLSGTGSWVDPPSTNGWFGFSSHFAQQAEIGDEPR